MRLTGWIAGAMALLCTVVSCEDVMTVTDYSFVFSGRHYASGDDNYISLNLDDGCPLQKYAVTYVIDDDPTLVLSDDNGAQVKSGASHDFGKGPKAWRLPLLRIGEHDVVFTIAGENFSQVLKVPFSIASEPFSLHAEVKSDLSAGTSTLLLSLAEGIADKDYSGFVYVDDEIIDKKGFSVNFRNTPILSIVMPLVRPGSHAICVEIGDGKGSDSLSFLYEEPLRYPDLQVEISRSPSTGKTRFMVRSNPYGLSVAVRDSLVVRGRCDYHVCAPYEDRVDYKTAYKEICDISQYDRFVPVVGRWYDLTDTQSKEDIITSQFMSNTTWSGYWSNTGEGGFEYIQVSDGISHYKIESSTHHMSVDFETLLGVTVRVSNAEKTVIWNRTPIGESYSYKLSSSSK